MQHGHEYTANDKEYKPGKIAMTLADMFGGQVDFYGIPFYADNFVYPANFDNQKYIEYVKKIKKLRNNKEFMSAYKIFQRMKSILERLSCISNNYLKISDEVYHNNNACSHDILFLQKLYEYRERQFGLSRCTEIDYYKALDMEAFRNSLEQTSIGTWKKVESFNMDPEFKDFSDRTNILLEFFDLAANKERTIINNEELLKEVSESASCKKQEIDELTKNRWVIVANESLDYATLLEEYYANFGMGSLEFSQMMQRKYDCEIKVPAEKAVSTKMMVYSK